MSHRDTRVFPREEIVVFYKQSLDLKVEMLEFEWEDFFDPMTFTLQHEYLTPWHDPHCDKI